MRQVFSSSSVSFTFLGMLLFGQIAERLKFRSSTAKLLLILAFVMISLHETLHALKHRENIFKLLEIDRTTSRKDLQANIRRLKETFRQAELSEQFIRIEDIESKILYNFDINLRLYFMYGDSFDVLQTDAITRLQISQLLLNAIIEFVATYVMLLLVLFIFFTSSARRGKTQRMVIVGMFLACIAGDYYLAEEMKLKDGRMVGVSELILDLLGCKSSTVPELRTAWRCFGMGLLIVVYLYGILQQHKLEDQLVIHLNTYYFYLALAAQALNQHQLPVDPSKVKECQSRLEKVKECGQKVLEEQQASAGFFKSVKQVHSAIYYGLVLFVVGINFYAKYG